MANRGGGWTEGRTDGRLEISPCVLQDIGPLGPLPCSHSTTSLDQITQSNPFRVRDSVGIGLGLHLGLDYS